MPHAKPLTVDEAPEDSTPILKAIEENFGKSLNYAEQLTKKANVDDDRVAAVKELFDDRQLVTLAASVTLANFTNRVNLGLGVELP